MYRDISGVHSNEVVNAIVQIPPWYTMHIVKCHFESHIQFSLSLVTLILSYRFINE